VDQMWLAQDGVKRNTVMKIWGTCKEMLYNDILFILLHNDS